MESRVHAPNLQANRASQNDAIPRGPKEEGASAKKTEVRAYVEKLAKKLGELSPELLEMAHQISQQKSNFDIAKESNRDINQVGQQVAALYRELGITAFKEHRRPLVTSAYKFYAVSTPTQMPAVKVPEGEILHPTAMTGVGTAEEGRAILERVRVAISNATYEVVPIERIRPMPNQPRKYFNAERLLRLSESIKAVGQITPGYLRVVTTDAENHDRELVDGERRWRAILMAGVTTFRAMLVDVDEEAAQYIVSVIANFNREGHTTLEIADSIRTMHEQLKLGIREIAESIGFSEMYVSNLYGLRRLAPEVRKMLDPDIEHNRKLPASYAIEISRLPAQYQLPLAQRVLSREVNIRTLRSEVVAMSEKHGIPIQQQVVDPSVQRRSIERKVTLLRRQSTDLKERLEGTSRYVLSGWATSNLLASCGDLQLARDDIDTSLKVLDGTKKPK